MYHNLRLMFSDQSLFHLLYLEIILQKFLGKADETSSKLFYIEGSVRHFIRTNKTEKKVKANCFLEQQRRDSQTRFLLKTFRKELYPIFSPTLSLYNTFAMNTKLPLGCLIFRFSDCLFGIEAAKKAAKKHKLHSCKVDNHNFEFFQVRYS